MKLNCFGHDFRGCLPLRKFFQLHIFQRAEKQMHHVQWLTSTFATRMAYMRKVDAASVTFGIRRRDLAQPTQKTCPRRHESWLGLARKLGACSDEVVSVTKKVVSVNLFWCPFS